MKASTIIKIYQLLIKEKENVKLTFKSYKNFAYLRLVIYETKWKSVLFSKSYKASWLIKRLDGVVFDWENIK